MRRERIQIQRRGAAGQTLLEMLAVVVIASTLMLATTSLLKALYKTQSTSDLTQTEMGEEAVGNRQVWLDARAARISFNFLSSGPCSNWTPDFYDYIPDAPCPAGNPACQLPCVTLGAAQAPLPNPLPNPAPPPLCSNPPAFVLASTTDFTAPAQPVSAHQFFTAAAPSVTQSAALTYAGDASVASFFSSSLGVSAVANPPLNNINTPTYMTPGNILLLYSPLSLRPPGNPNVPPRMMSLVASVPSPNTLDITQPAWLSCEAHPLMTWLNLSAPNSSLENFFRTLPPVGGQGAFLMVMQIQVVRYSTAPLTTFGGQALPAGQQAYVLYRQTCNPAAGACDPNVDGGGWTSKHTVANGIICAKFSRESVAIPSIGVGVQMYDPIIGAQSKFPQTCTL